MARYAVLQIALFVLASICLIQAKSSIGTLRRDIIEDFTSNLLKTIKEENITCENYEKFCENSNEQFQTGHEPKLDSTNEMAIQLCKAILEAYVCANDV